jgi:hypothetical protein
VVIGAPAALYVGTFVTVFAACLGAAVLMGLIGAEAR